MEPKVTTRACYVVKEITILEAHLSQHLNKDQSHPLFIFPLLFMPTHKTTHLPAESQLLQALDSPTALQATNNPSHQPHPPVRTPHHKALYKSGLLAFAGGFLVHL